MKNSKNYPSTVDINLLEEDFKSSENLLVNYEEMKNWTILNNGGNGWKEEEGCKPNFAKCCFVSSFGWCSMQIKISF